jgi:hypothetical protein
MLLIIGELYQNRDGCYNHIIKARFVFGKSTTKFSFPVFPVRNLNLNIKGEGGEREEGERREGRRKGEREGGEREQEGKGEQDNY